MAGAKQPRRAVPAVTEQMAPPAAQREVEWKPISSLLLDPLNPRLPDGMEADDQTHLLAALARDYRLQELAQSLADNGYFAEEPLVAVPGPHSQTWTVVEGNRRLAAMKLLASPTSAPKTLQPIWTDLSRSRKYIISNAPVLIYPKRADVTPYLGFRHITGVLEWEPYQKARYIAQLIETQGHTFEAIAREIGSKPSNVREHYVAYSIVRQCRDQFALDTEMAERSFGVLRRALSDPDIRSFIDLSLTRSEAELRTPIPETKRREIRELLTWMFGSDEAQPALTDSRDLKKLGLVLSKTETVNLLRATGRLDHAYELSDGEESRLIDFLSKASYFLDQALPMLVRHGSSAKVKHALERCRETFEALNKVKKND